MLSVHAIDGDRGVNNRISYSIISGGEEQFDIDRNSGVIFTINPLDREDPENNNGAYILEILVSKTTKGKSFTSSRLEPQFSMYIILIFTKRCH